jgi:bifunctional DNA-binding transcriptional regulator/antitoxin component of YhaV-PrlF toxin-antitoxin module
LIAAVIGVLKRETDRVQTGTVSSANHYIVITAEMIIIAKTRVTSGFRIIIPKEIRDKQGVVDGMDVIWYEQDAKINQYFRKAVKSIKELRGTISVARIYQR